MKLQFSFFVALLFAVYGPEATYGASNETLDKLLEALSEFTQYGNIIYLEMNSTIDAVLIDLNTVIAEEGMDPMKLENQTFDLVGIAGTTQLTNGTLKGMATVFRHDDIIVSYNLINRVVTFSLPLGFRELLFSYDYNTSVLLIEGDLQGKTENFQLNLLVTYDAFNGFVLGDLDINDPGNVTLTFTGNDMKDWLTNAMSLVIVESLYPLVVEIIGSNVKSLGSEVVAAIDDYINNSTMLM